MVVRLASPAPISGRRRIVIVVVAVLAGLLLAFTALSGFFVDVLWFRRWVSPRSSGRCWTRACWAGVRLFFAALWLSLWIVRKITPIPALRRSRRSSSATGCSSSRTRGG
jgi:hypothetical protein